MSAIYIHRYVLTSAAPANRLVARREFQGALVRIGSGFACIHPWPELGDLGLDDQLALLADGKGSQSPLLERSLECARLDGAAREDGISLFAEAEIPQSHWLWNSGMNSDEQRNTIASGGFRAVKVKCDGTTQDGGRLGAIVDGLPQDVRFRLDLNAALDSVSAVPWMGSLPESMRKRIEFIEDPMRYEAAAWRKLAGEFGIDLALDRAGGGGGAPGVGYRWRVVKPAVDGALEWVSATTGAGLIFTSYLDHPLGQVFAAYCAAMAARGSDFEVGVCGLVSHLWFERNAFSEALGVADGGRLQLAEGSGLGFGDLLESLPWERL